MLDDKIEVWVCDHAPSCSDQQGSVCYTYDEVLEVFIPWGLWRQVLGPALDDVAEDESSDNHSSLRAAFVTFESVEEISEVW